MSVLTEWFEGRLVDDELERAYWGRIVTEIACAVCLGIILAGCASVSPSPRTEVCYMRLLGSTEDWNVGGDVRMRNSRRVQGGAKVSHA